VREIFQLYLDYGSLVPVVQELDRRGWTLKAWTTREGRKVGGTQFTKAKVYKLLTNAAYAGKVKYEGRVFEGDAPAREVLREAAPGGEVQLVGRLQLRQVTVQARSLGQQAEDPPLVEHVDVVLPDHVIDRAQLAAVSDQQRRQTCEAVSHQLTSGSGTETAKPARNTGCGKPSGATSGALP